MTTLQNKPTVRAVIEAARQTNNRAHSKSLQDPWARPYTITEAAARKLCSQQTQIALKAARQLHERGEVSDELLEQLLKDAPHVGARRAIDIIAERAAAQDAREREDREEAQRREQRHARRQKQFRRDEQARRRGLSPGARIDEALAKLAVVSNVPAARIDGDIIHGGERSQQPAFYGDVHAAARDVALQASDKIERMLDQATTRHVA